MVKWFLFIGFSIFLFIQCSPNTTAPSPSECPDKQSSETFKYRVHLNAPTSFPLNRVPISLTIRQWEFGDTVQLLVPFIYADNPIATNLPTPLITSIQVRNNSCTPISYSLDTVFFGTEPGLQSMRISIPIPSSNPNLLFPMSVSYEAKMSDSGKAVTPLSFLQPYGGYIQGSFQYIVPYRFPELVKNWRTPLPTVVEYVGNVTLQGTPTFQEYPNLYGLMFSTTALNGTLLSENTVLGQHYQYVTIGSGPLVVPEKVIEHTDSLFYDIFQLFPRLSHPITVILGINRFGGLEGYHGFSMIDPTPNVVDQGIFAMILAHEIIHSWIGVRVGDLEDPWWKEGTTNYLGFLLAVRNGIMPEVLFKNVLFHPVDTLPVFSKYHLSQPAVRNNLYNVSGMYNLVYDGGAQVCLLLDEKIRRETNGQHQLITVLADFVRVFHGKGFTRTEYLQFIQNKTKVDVSDIFSLYVDQKNKIPLETLQNAWNSLRQYSDWKTSSVPVHQGSDASRTLKSLQYH